MVLHISHSHLTLAANKIEPSNRFLYCHQKKEFLINYMITNSVLIIVFLNNNLISIKNLLTSSFKSIRLCNNANSTKYEIKPMLTVYIIGDVIVYSLIPSYVVYLLYLSPSQIVEDSLLVY